VDDGDGGGPDSGFGDPKDDGDEEFFDANFFFVTSTTYTGNLGGFAGADSICQTRAAAGGLAGTYVAVLEQRILDFTQDSRGWVRPDRRPFADEWQAFLGGPIWHPPIIDEFGNQVPGDTVRVWRGFSISNCNEWLGAAFSSPISFADHTNGWDDGDGTPLACTEQAHLYCAGIDQQVEIRIKGTAGRIAFVSMAAFEPSTGLAAADNICATEAATYGWPGSYKALLATTTASALSRFSLDGLRWRRPDGVPIIGKAADMATSTHLQSSINQAADRETFLDNRPRAWFGAPSLTVPGSADDTCNDWSSAAPTGRLGQPNATFMGRAFGGWQDRSCGNSFPIYCLQEGD
jgi:hypothetical protein